MEEGKERQEKFRRLREEKKFAAKVQREVSSVVFSLRLSENLYSVQSPL